MRARVPSRPLRLGALVLLVLLAGCTAPPGPAGEPEAASAREGPPALAPFVLHAREPRLAPVLDVSVSLSERWIKPLRGLDAHAQAPPGAALAWFVELDGEEPRATTFGGDLYLLKASTPDHRNADGPRAPLRPTELAPDGRALALRLPVPGRHAWAAEAAELVVNVWPDAPEGPAQAFLLEDRGGLAFDPPELDVRPGTRVLLWSQASRAVEVREVAYAAYVPLAARDGHLTAVDEGLWTLVALAADGPARGVGRMDFLVDFERPSERMEAGPFTGSFVAPEAGLDAPRRIEVRAAHPLARLVVAFSAGSTAPAPAAVHVRLLHEGALLAEASSATASELALAELPAGAYAIEVRGEQGASVSWEVRVDGVYRLPVPARLRESMT